MNYSIVTMSPSKLTIMDPDWRSVYVVFHDAIELLYSPRLLRLGYQRQYVETNNRMEHPLSRIVR